MSSPVVASVAFVCLVAGAALGMVLGRLLPEAHFSPDSRDVVKVAMGLVATMAALVLGLLVASAKGAFDTQESEFREVAANILLIDRVLAGYGPETRDVRDLVRRGTIQRLATMWPEDAAGFAPSDRPGTTALVEDVEARIRRLSPQDDEQRILQARAVQLAGEVAKTRWPLLGGAGTEIQTPFLVVVVFWLSALFTSFGLFAPRNATVVAVLLLAALSVATAIFLVLELDSPFTGTLKISRAPLRYTIAHLGA